MQSIIPAEGLRSSANPALPGEAAAVFPFAVEEVEGAVCTRFEKVAARFPERLAVQTKRDRLTYRALNRRANAVAHALIAQRGGVQEPIALLFEQGSEVIVALLGVLKGGAFYVPIDPLFPAARNARILEDSGARLILTNRRNGDAARKLAAHGQTVLCLEDIPATDGDAANPNLSIAPSHLAYILYTSGSTGEPKGVMQTHRNILFDIRRHGDDLGTTRDDRYGLLFAAGSSASVCHIFGALLNGASVLPFDIRESGFAALKDWLADEEITILDITTATFRLLCDALPDKPSFPKLRLLAPGSEPVYRRDVELYRKHFAPTCVMQNALGTTETRTATQYFLTKETPVAESLVPMGLAIPGKDVLLLDERGREVAHGEIGEIAVRSRYLSPGYWRKPEQTAAVFLPDPDGGDRRIYLTGDLGQVNADGLLVHLGRKDFQVKIRGYRVEIPEVEMALVKLPGVVEAAAGAPEITAGNRELVAYLVMLAGQPPTVREFRARLAEGLPDYAVPTRFEFLGALPQTLNGKLDRRALPIPRPVRTPSPEGFVAPTTDIEKRVASLFEEVLGVQPVGAADDFFELGGHSLLVARLTLRIEEETRRTLPLSALLSAPTVRQLAELLSDDADPGRRLSPIPIQKGGDRTPLFCVPGSAGTAMEFQKLSSYLGPDQPVYGLEPIGIDGRAAPDCRIEAMAQRYLDEMRTVQPHGPYLLLGFSMGGMVVFEMARRLSAAGERAAFVGLIDTAFPETLPFPVRGHGPANADSRASDGLSARWLRQKIGRGVRAAQFDLGRVTGGAASRSVRDKHLQTVHRRAAQIYRPEIYDGRLTYFLAYPPGSAPDPLYPERGWADLTTGGIESVPLAGAHNLTSEPSVGLLARYVREGLDFDALRASKSKT